VNTSSCTYKKVNNRGVIFGHRELFHQGVGKMVAFLGTHYFHGAPAFEVTTMTESGQTALLWVNDGRMENRVFDGSRFIGLGSIFGKPENVRPYAMNEKLQVVGLSDWSGA
jgi:hypothetical protein